MSSLTLNSEKKAFLPIFSEQGTKYTDAEKNTRT